MSSSGTYDAIVVGLGGVGSATLYQLASRGLSVLGIDRYSPPHTYGSSHGQTRVFRTAYFEHPSYVPLLRRAADLWRLTEEHCGEELYHKTGLLEIGPRDGVVIPGILRSAAEFDLPIETMSMADAKDQFPGIEGPENWTAVVEAEAGFLAVEACIENHLALAQQRGATVRYGTTVDQWKSVGDGMELRLGNDRVHAARVVLAGGPWSAQWLAKYEVELSIVRKHIYWYETHEQGYHQSSGFPCYFFETRDGFFYGTPAIDDAGVKVARHSGGEQITDPEKHHTRDPQDQRQCESFLKTHLPKASQNQTHWSGCYYTVTPDEHFIIDHMPEMPHVTVVAGLSGHGFKFASVLGEIAAQSVVEESTEFDLDFLRLVRLL
ncbi:MAG: N-methyl-L-tryptophan oxidase [Planctomycetota bacterium]